MNGLVNSMNFLKVISLFIIVFSTCSFAGEYRLIITERDVTRFNCKTSNEIANCTKFKYTNGKWVKDKEYSAVSVKGKSKNPNGSLKDSTLIHGDIK